MKFTIRALIFWTLLVALSAHAFLQWQPGALHRLYREQLG